MASATLNVPGIHCDHCKEAIEGAVGQLDGVETAEVSVQDRTVSVAYDEDRIGLDHIRDTIIEQGYDLPA